MQKKLCNKTIFNLTDKNYIAQIGQAFKDVENQYPEVINFLEEYCGFYMPVLSSDPQEIAYSSGKRDVILTIKTLMRNDIDPENIACFYKQRM